MAKENYAFIKDGLVINIAVFEDPDNELLMHFKDTFSLDHIIPSEGVAIIGGTYDGNNFIPPAPWPSWVLDTNLRKWNPPIPMPYDENLYLWNEETLSWEELYIEDIYKISWSGTTKPRSPSILMDAVYRSGNQFFNEVIHQAFPTAFQHWGYMDQQNPESFAAAIGKFDVVATIVRNPIDSTASSIVAFNFTNNEQIILLLEKTLEMLTAIQNNKENISIFNFDEVIANPTTAVSRLANELNIEPEPYNEEIIRDRLSITQTGSFYALPNENNDLLEEAKGTLAGEEFIELLTQCTDIYTELIA
jgi:hypothetical protein